ncbi:hypothetical protein WN943_022003 [Citrus x changshan-huyou]
MSEDVIEFMMYAASTGKLELISTLIRYEADLPNVRDEENLLPIHRAAKQGQRNVVCYLLEKTRAPLDGSDGVFLLEDLINSNLFGIPVQEEYNPHAHAHSENVDGDLEKQLTETYPILHLVCISHTSI